MEIIDYTPPTSWDDKGMNWDEPDPLNIDYFMAIYDATKERFVVGSSSPGNIPIHRLINGSPLSAETIIGLNNWIISVAQSYLNVESLQNIYTPTEINALSLFSSITAKNVMGEMACKFGSYSSSYAYSSLNNDNIKKWIKEAKVFLQKTKYIKTQHSVNTVYKYVNYGKNIPVTYDEIKSELIIRFNNNPWITTTVGSSSPTVEAVFRKFYNSAGDITSLGGRIFVISQKYTLLPYKKTDFNVFCYMKLDSLLPYYSKYNSIFYPQQTFPYATIIESMYSKVSMPQISTGYVIDMLSLLNQFPEYPLESEVPEYILDDSVNEALKGYSDNFAYNPVFIADYSKGFNFK